MWLPEGTNINETDRMASSLADSIYADTKKQKWFLPT